MTNFELWHSCCKWAIYCAVTVKAKCRREGQNVISVFSAALVQVQQCLAQDLLSWGTADYILITNFCALIIIYS
jgi:hypothetical protein